MTKYYKILMFSNYTKRWIGVNKCTIERWNTEWWCLVQQNGTVNHCFDGVKHSHSTCNSTASMCVLRIFVLTCFMPNFKRPCERLYCTYRTDCHSLYSQINKVWWGFNQNIYTLLTGLLNRYNIEWHSALTKYKHRYFENRMLLTKQV